VFSVLRTSAFALAVLASIQTFAQQPAEWPAYGGDLGGTRFSSLDEINRKNVANLKVAWTFRAGGHGKSGTPQGDYVIAYALP